MSSAECSLLRGQCRFDFEGHEFLLAGETMSFENYCWLSASPEVRQELASLLGLDLRGLEFAGWIEVEFYGHVTCAGGQYGHFGIYSRQATIAEMIHSRILPPSVESNAHLMNIRARLRHSKNVKRGQQSDN